ncbi:MAG: hypothetical protein GF329_12585 [Candidatus Lokiarchaeota archaeon]|nr:hypothetical protein [Candidatus Lokiarchaeota archaeon]
MLKREYNILIVKGLDAINRTPVIDIKPYLPNYDLIESAELPEWIIKLSNYFSHKVKDEEK